MSEVISMDESRRLVDLEKTIQSGLQTFVEVGEALAEIRDARLYRIEYGTFEEYCIGKWNLKKSRVYQLIDAANVTASLKSSTKVELPDTERQTRPLTKLPAEQRPAAWEKAVKAAGGEQPTAKQVEEAVKEVSNSSVPAPVKREKEPIPSMGITYANLAITQLQKINANDTQREEAFKTVIRWINEH